MTLSVREQRQLTAESKTRCVTVVQEEEGYQLRSFTSDHRCSSQPVSVSAHITMAQALHSVTGVLRTSQLPEHRASWCSEHRCKLASTATAITTTACHKLKGTGYHAGKAWNQKPDVRCNSAQSQPLQQQGPNISRLDPALQQQWDLAANAHLGNMDIKPHTKRKVWWTCDQCPDGHLHRWEARVSLRTDGTGCPQCSSHKVCKHNSLATKAPLVAAQWDYEANVATPDSVLAQSSQAVAWHCDVCGNKWSASPNARVGKNKRGCPQCGDRAKTKKQIKHPTFAECQDPHSKACLAQWDHERNAPQGNFPHNTTLRSKKQIFWLCDKCPAEKQHSWVARPYHRTARTKPGCPFCVGQAACKCNSLQALYPAIAAEWDYSKNHGTPSDYTAHSNRPAWWVSPQHGSWQHTICTRTDPRLVCNRSEQ